jgi:hypothetical protein
MVQLAWLGLAGTEIDSATKYEDPQDGQSMSEIFMGSTCARFDHTRSVLNQCGARKAVLVGYLFEHTRCA